MRGLLVVALVRRPGTAVALAAGLLACGGGSPAVPTGTERVESRPSVAPSASKDVTRDAPEPPSVQAQSPNAPPADDPNEFRAPWCEGPGRDPGARLVLMYDVARDYDTARTADCRTVGLLPPLSEQKQKQWWDYLLGYSALLAGCAPLPISVPGGILEFGPANTAAIDLPRPVLGREEAALLLEQYLSSFSARLALTEAEQRVVETQLQNNAERVIDDTAAADALSRCAEEAP